MKTENLQKLIVHALEEMKANDIVVLDVHALTSITDRMIICSARSSRHLQSLADNVIQQAKKHHINPPGIDGKNSSEWILIDLGDVVTHIMMPTTRELYHLEKLWESNP